MESLNSKQHPDELLPWLANRTLGAAERLEVEAHLATCARCRSELAWLEALQSGVAEHELAQAPGEFGLNRLLQNVRQRSKSAQRNRWLAPALAASIAIVVLQGVMLVQLSTRPERIVPLGSKLQDADVLQIRFDPRATEADMRDALQAVGASMIEGPGALGIYRVRLEPGASGKSMAASLALKSLKARHGVVVQVVSESKRTQTTIN